MLLERLVGLYGQAPVEPGLYFPYQLLEAQLFLQRLEKDGGELIELDGEVNG